MLMTTWSNLLLFKHYPNLVFLYYIGYYQKHQLIFLAANHSNYNCDLVSANDSMSDLGLSH